jgi:hypothetical protein
MIDEKLIEELREYLKDHYTPENDSKVIKCFGLVEEELPDYSDDSVTLGCACLDEEELPIDSYDSKKNDSCFSPVVGSYHAYSLFVPAINKKIKSFRDISDDASEYIKKNRKPGGFAYALEQKRKERKLTPAELYKRANVDRRQYSRLMGPEGRHPSKNTVISFALALHLGRGEFDEFLKTAGYSLSSTSSRDVCIMFCIEKGHYDIDKVNAVLFAVGIDPLTRDSG